MVLLVLIRWTNEFIGVLIVDTKSDLNVYFTANEAQSSCCKGAGGDLAQNASSCAPPRSAGSLETGGDVLSNRSSITDFNQWAGMGIRILTSRGWLTDSL